TIGLVLATAGGQWVAVALLPRTEGFTRLIPTIGCAACFVFSAWAIARLTHGGADVSVVIPLIAAIIPLGAVAIGILLYREPASLLRVVLLLSACGLIGAASFIG
ncbi:MAG TPA: SMR family transporter, partial [Vicinamibacterales bacterium]|nr:SMR family transporter [Vicinamibacterales bacterium]